MGIQTVKVLRTISKIVLLVVGIGIIGYGGLVIYKSVINKPQRVRITNVTDSAATITWVTDNPVRGVVYYKDEGSFLPGPLGLIGSKVAYDDRDFALAQDECVKAFNENANITKDANFTVDASGFDCENISIEKLGAYYTHSVTIKNLNESSTYFFVVGNGIWSWSVDDVDKDISENDLAVTNSFNFKTATLLEEVPTPNIAYGTVYAGVKSEEGYLSESLSKDSLVYAYLIIDGRNSQVISAVTNIDGGWTFDKSNFRDTEGDLVTDLTKAKMMVRTQFEDVKEARWVDVVDGLDVDTELDLQGNLVDDLTEGEKKRIIKQFEDLVGKVYAVVPNTECPSTLPIIENDTTYTCFRNCDMDWSVSGCGMDSFCMKKCDHVAVTKYGKWETRDWIKFGTVSEGKCNLNPACGCIPGDCGEEDCSAKTHKICQPWHDWSGKRDGLCTPTSKCGCKEDDCKNLDGGGRKVCRNNVWKTEEGDCTDLVEKLQCKSGNGKIDHGECLGTSYCDDGVLLLNDTRCELPCKRVGECINTPSGHRICGEDLLYGSVKSGKCGELPCKSGNNKIDHGKCLGTSYCNNGVLLSGNEKCKVEDPSKQCVVKPDYLISGNKNGCVVYSLITCIVRCGTEPSSFILPNMCNSMFGVKSLYNKCAKDNEEIKDVDVNISEIDLSSAGPGVLKKLVSRDASGTIRERVDSEMDKILAKYRGDKFTCNNYLEANSSDMKKATEYCKSLEDGRKLVPVGLPKRCLKSGSLLPSNVYEYQCSGSKSMKMDFASKAYAEESTSSGYTLYLPEYGMYSFQLGDYKLATSSTSGNTYYIFYIEANDKAGFQMPADPDHPTPKEDIMLKSDSAQIQHEKIASAQAYTLVKGINIISFNFLPVSTDLGPLTAKGVITEAAKKGVTIQYISSFDGGRWSKGYTCKNGKCSGNDFNIIPGKGYLVYATKGGEMIIPGYTLRSSVPVNLSGGWNLVGIHGYANVYTARTLIDSMNEIDGVTTNNVTWWPTSKGMYEGLQVTGGQQYGFDFPISPTNGYFVRVSSFKPTDKKCKSLLWNEGGVLNGSCGIVK